MIRSDNRVSAFAKLVVVGALLLPLFAACTSQLPTEGSSAVALATDPGPSKLNPSLVGLYRVTAMLGPVPATLPSLPTLKEFVLLQPGGTGVGFSGTHNFSSFSLQNNQVPSNAVGSLVTWQGHDDHVEIRMLRPIYLPNLKPNPVPTVDVAEFYVG